MSETVEKLDNLTFKITNTESNSEIFSITTVLAKKLLLENRLVAFDARKVSDRLVIVGQIAAEADLVQKAIAAGIVIPS